jgi:hypothetical protein
MVWKVCTVTLTGGARDKRVVIPLDFPAFPWESDGSANRARPARASHIVTGCWPPRAMDDPMPTLAHRRVIGPAEQGAGRASMTGGLDIDVTCATRVVSGHVDK